MPRTLKARFFTLLFPAMPLFCPTLSAQNTPPHLIPTPREIRQTAIITLQNGLEITCTPCLTSPEDNFTAQNLKESLISRKIPTNGPIVIFLTHTQSLPPEAQAEGYSISPGADYKSLTLAAATSAGLFYAAQTLEQLIENDGPKAVLHLAQVVDWPALKYRGVHDDLSRGPVPTLAFQKSFVKTLAAYKINLYSPYFEHTQQYAANPLFAPPGGSMSAQDARELVAYAEKFHITIIPEQEAFGHLHHNLTWESYATLAETPHGAVLAPGQPGSIQLIHQMFAELASLYPSPLLHIGADETQDLGQGQTRSDVEARGLGPVYLDFLQRITTDLSPLNRRLLFWGDIAQEVNQTSPDLLRSLPAAFKENTIAVAWWYTPQPKGFAKYLTPFTSAGFETWVATGVNNWSVVYPDNNDALANIQQFVLEGQRQHSTGLLNTIWHDDGESLANSNWYGLLFGAQAGWHQGESSIPQFQQSFAQVFHGDSSGALNEAQTELMAAHALLRTQAKVGDGSDGLFWIDPWSKDGQTIAPKIHPYLHDLRLHAERALTLIAQARAANPDLSAGAPNYEATPFPSNPTTLHHTAALDALELGARRFDLIGLKFQLAEEIAQGYTRAQTAALSTDKQLHATTGPELSNIRGINGRLEDIRDTYALLRELYSQAWLQSNRPYALRPVLAHYDATIQLWQLRSDRFRSAQRQYSDTKTLPAATDLGLPKN